MHYLNFEIEQVYYTKDTHYGRCYEYLYVNDNLEMGDEITIHYCDVEYVQTRTSTELRFIFNKKVKVHKLRGAILYYDRVMILLIDLFKYHVDSLECNKHDVKSIVGRYLIKKIKKVFDFIYQISIEDCELSMSQTYKYIKFINEIPNYDINDVSIVNTEEGDYYFNCVCRSETYLSNLIVKKYELYESGDGVYADIEIIISMCSDHEYFDYHIYDFETRVYANEVCIADICEDKFKYEKEVRVIVDLMMKFRLGLLKCIDEIHEDYLDELPIPMIKSARKI